MSDETNYEKNKVPEFNEHGITDWLDEFKGFLMRHKRAHLAFSVERPEEDPDEVARLTNANAEATLRRYRLDIKDDQAEWDERNETTISYLMECTKGESHAEAHRMILDHLKDKKVSKEIAEALTTRFDSVDPRVVNAVIKKWSSLKIIPGERATSFITRLQEVQENLRKKGKTYTDGELVGRLLEGLDGEPRYAMIVAAMETVKGLTWEAATEQLRTKDTKDFLDGDGTSETAAMARSSSAPSAPPRNGGGNNVCQICKKSGHIATTCRWRNESREHGDRGSNKDKKDKKKKKIKCFNCGGMGHYANECRKADTRKGNGKRPQEDHKGGTSEPESKRVKTEKGDGAKGSREPWDKDEFSGMMQESGGRRA